MDMLDCSIRSSGTARLRETGLQKRHIEFTGEKKFIQNRQRLNNAAGNGTFHHALIAPTTFSRSDKSACHVVSLNSDVVAVIVVTTLIQRFQLKNVCLDNIPIFNTPSKARRGSTWIAEMR